VLLLVLLEGLPAENKSWVNFELSRPAEGAGWTAHFRHSAAAGASGGSQLKKGVEFNFELSTEYTYYGTVYLLRQPLKLPVIV
jgi:hypothetical protein